LLWLYSRAGQQLWWSLERLIKEDPISLLKKNPSRISIIIPVLDEAELVEDALQALQVYRQVGHEIILVDGGSQDQSMALAKPFTDQLLQTDAGRALQMNAGAAQAKHDILLFLHIDTFLPDAADQLVLNALLPPKAKWGRFSVLLENRRFIFRVIEWSINVRSALSGVATGDQAIFVKKEAFEGLGGYDAVPLMEDVALSKKLRALAWPVCLRAKVKCSSRRWEKHGVLKTILLMWRLRLAYFFGAEPALLFRKYYGSRHD